MASSKDGTARIWTVQPVPGYIPVTLSAHKTAVIAAYFDHPPHDPGQRLKTVFTVSMDGAIVTWSCAYPDEKDKTMDEDRLSSTETLENLTKSAVSFFTSKPLSTDNDAPVVGGMSQADYLPHATWSAVARHYFNQNETQVTASAYSPLQKLLVVGFSSGLFALYELPSMSNIHTLSISNQIIKTVTINKSGEWLAFGCPSTQQLLVWEWRSETYIIKQKGHAYGMKCMVYSPDGIIVATGGEDGSIKMWNSTTGFCYCTFKSHTAPITSVCFANSSVVISSSLDGTVRAHDLHRYRNFKTYTSPTPTQFTSLAVDPAGEIITAGSMEPFHVYVWNLQTGKLLDILTGHTGPVSELSFHPIRGTLASASWDGTVKIWDLYKREGQPESIQHLNDVVCCAFRPDGLVLCTGTIGGLLCFWNLDECSLIYEIDGKKDITGGEYLCR
jgi:periodic tryptophan protein 2